MANWNTVINYFLVAALFGLAAMVVAPHDNKRIGCLLFWSGSAVVCVSSYFIGHTQGWQSGVALSIFSAAAIVFTAYVNTPFMKVQGRGYSFYSDHKEPYGARVTARKSWWRVVFVIMLLTFGVASYFIGKNEFWLSLVAAATIALTSTLFGYRDAVLEHQISSGQHIQFIIVSIITLGIFAVLYLSAYYCTKRWLVPYQTHGRHSRLRH